MTDPALVKLMTDRLLLRALDAADGNFVARLLSDPEVRRFLGGPVPTADQARTLARYLRDDFVWCLCPQAGGAPVGLLSLSPHHDGAEMELSFQLLPKVWGRGYATEAARRLARFAFEDLGLGHLIAETQTANAASRRLLERIGMREDRRVVRFGAEQVIYRLNRTPDVAILS